MVLGRVRVAAMLGTVLFGVLDSSLALAQQSAHYRQQEQVIDAGGHPVNGVVPASAGFRITLDAIGGGLVSGPLNGASFGVAGGFARSYPPPGEVRNVAFTGATTLSWDPEASVGDYNLYRGTVPSFLPLYGDCAQREIPSETAVEADTPTPGGIFFYLVTAENLLDEEGTKGFNSAGMERANLAPCP